ncbi:MAG: hypothetical protein H6732_06050 [Alphaproteobacteria bacterium]|nr:hypothetical protein [Alphaproteobacteria bacterium]
MRTLLALVAALACTASQPAHAAPEDEALSCVATKSYEAYQAGWRSRDREVITQTADALWKTGTTLLAGVEYRIVACADPGSSDVQLALYDTWGKPVVQDEQVGRDAELSIKVPTTGGYYLVARGVPAQGFQSSVAIAVLYK